MLAAWPRESGERGRRGGQPLSPEPWRKKEGARVRWRSEEGRREGRNEGSETSSVFESFLAPFRPDPFTRASRLCREPSLCFAKEWSVLVCVVSGPHRGT